MQVEFDPNKAAANRKKHGVSFDAAAGSLLDPFALVREDEDAEGEMRFVLVGMSHEGLLLTVCYTLREEETIRLISARQATRREERQYAEGI
ncbi:MAG TPA: BrnT family toxin [Thermoanaerobaculia bacterium]|nr:BrnT family toxin [Thermoanaerobaculia bacterium]